LQKKGDEERHTMGDAEQHRMKSGERPPTAAGRARGVTSWKALGEGGARKKEA